MCQSPIMDLKAKHDSQSPRGKRRVCMYHQSKGVRQVLVMGGEVFDQAPKKSLKTKNFTFLAFKAAFQGIVPPK